VNALAAWIEPKRDWMTLICWCEACARWHRHGRGGYPAAAEFFGWRAVTTFGQVQTLGDRLQPTASPSGVHEEDPAERFQELARLA
jgi:hypothetical protein